MATRRLLSALILSTLVSATQAQEAPREADSGSDVSNWAAPGTWSPSRPNVVSGVPANAVTSPMPFVGVNPCRLADTRDATKPPGYGPPALTAGVPRNFVVAGQCGIDPNAQAISLNLTVVNPQGIGYILVFPQGGPFAPVSTLNYVAGETIANAAIVPVGTNGGITVDAGVSGTDLIIDVNGYFGEASSGAGNTFLGLQAGNSTMTGFGDSGFGYYALGSNTTGNSNTALGAGTLSLNTGGFANVAVGASALNENLTGHINTAVGASALLQSTGSLNTALGYYAGFNLHTGDRNIYIGHGGSDGDNGTIRVGDPSQQALTFIVGIRGVTTGNADAIPVVIDSAGQLGTVSSSARFKKNVRDMADESSGLLRLRPVTFQYKGQTGGPTQFGLIAEEVEEVLPDLVVHDAAGQAETVLYHEMPAMLLNELQKQQATIERQQHELDRLAKLVEALVLRDADRN